MKKNIGKKFTAFALAVMIVTGSLFSETLISEAAGSENKYYIYTDNWSEYTNKKDVIMILIWGLMKIYLMGFQILILNMKIIGIYQCF